MAAEDTPLVGALCPDASPELRAEVQADPGGAEALLRAALDRARAAWPMVAVADEVFLRYLAPRLGGPPLSAALAQVQVGDLYLASGCILGDPAALRAFDERVLSQVGAFLASQRPTPELVDEVRQRLRERLLVARLDGPPRIAEYGGRGSLGGFVRVAAVRVALNLHRNKDDQPGVRGGSDPAVLEGVGLDPELAVLRARCGAAFKGAFQDALGGLPAELRLVLQLHTVKGLGVDQIGAVLKMSRATASRRVVAAREEVARRTRQLLAERLQLTTGEIQSLTGLVLSQVDLSIARCLRDDSDED